MRKNPPESESIESWTAFTPKKSFSPQLEKYLSVFCVIVEVSIEPVLSIEM